MTGRSAGQIRGFEPFDLPGLYDVCLRTGDAGVDATGLYNNRDLLGHIYAGPYPIADPTLAFILADADGVAGYSLATADSVGFDQWCERHWWPRLREQYPAELASDPGDGSHDWQLISRIHAPLPEPEAVYERYPAHLHIDLLPRAQGQGAGRRLIDSLTDALRDRGVPGVHLGVGARNQHAQGFYRHLGFGVYADEPWGMVMTLDLS